MPILAWRIRADGEEIGRTVSFTMPAAGGKHDHIPRIYGGLPSAFATEDKACGSGGESEDLVHIGMVMMESVDVIAPLRGPSVAGERPLKDGGRVGRTGDFKGVSIEQHG